MSKELGVGSLVCLRTDPAKGVGELVEIIQPSEFNPKYCARVNWRDHGTVVSVADLRWPTDNELEDTGFTYDKTSNVLKLEQRTAEAVTTDPFYAPENEQRILEEVVAAAEGIRPIRRFTPRESSVAHVRLWSALDDLAIHRRGGLIPKAARGDSAVIIHSALPGSRRVVVGFSGGVTSAWCAGWALRTYPRGEVVLLFHDTKEEHQDTYRFLREMSQSLGVPITERSDGRSVTEVFRDEGFLGNNQNAMCSRILKSIPGDRFTKELQVEGHKVVRVFGFSKGEPDRVQRAAARGLRDAYDVRFPLVEEDITKQQASEWVLAQGVKPSAMYCWAEHANCVGCVKGGKAYWLAVAKHAPDVFAQRIELEAEFGHGILRGGNREHTLLKDLVQLGLKRKVNPREAIDIGPCECGD